MKLASNFEMVKVVDDYMLIPVGDQMDAFNGTVVLNEVSAFLLEKMKDDVTEEDLVQFLIENYEVEPSVAQKDVNDMLEEMRRIGIVHE